MKKTLFLLVSIWMFNNSCTVVKNGQTTACESKILIFNTGLSINGVPSDYGTDLFPLFADNTRDGKWSFCTVNYDDLNPFPTNYSTYNFKCTNSTTTLIRPDIIKGISLDNGSNTGLQQTNNLFKQSKWVVADAGRIVHTTPYYHIFTNGFCLTSQEKSNAENIKLNIQTFDSPIISIIVNGVVIWSNNSPSVYVFDLMNFVISKTNLVSGLNEIRIVTIKANTRSDNTTTNDMYCTVQSTGLDVSGYLMINKCCN